MRKPLPRILSLLLALCLCLGLAPAALAAEETQAASSGPFSFQFSDGEATLTGYDAMADNRASHVDIPATATDAGGNTCPVTAIDRAVFQNCSWLTSVTIPDSITSIGTYAFEGTGLTSVTIPSSVTEWGGHIFWQCESLSSVTLPENMTEIPSGLFSHCSSLSSVRIPSGVTSIGNQAFQECGLTSVNLPSGLTSIGEYAFDGNPLTSLTLPDGLREVGDGAFKDCTSITSLNFPASLTTIGEEAFMNTGITSLRIPATLTSIGNSAFEECDRLTSVTVEDGVKELSYQMFYHCTRLSSVDLGETVEDIRGAFDRCTALQTITVPASVTELNGAFEQCDNLRLVYMNPMTAPDMIASSTFTKRTSLSSALNTDVVIVIPQGATGYDNSEWRQLTIIHQGDPIPEIPELPDIEDPENPEPVRPGAEALTLSTTRLDFGTFWRGDLREWPERQAFTITNTGESTVWIDDVLYPRTYILVGEPDYISSGSVSSVTIRPDTGLDAGNYDGTLTIVTTDGSSIEVELAFTVQDGISPEMASAELPAGFTADAQCLGVERVVRHNGDSRPLFRFPVGTRIQAVDGTVIQRIYVPIQADYREPVDNSFTLPYVSQYIIEAVDADGNPVVLATDSVEAPKPEEPALPFTDVKEGDWYYDAVTYVYENGVMSGTSASAFQPAGQLSRAMVAQVLWNLAGTPAAGGSAGFADVAAGAWYAGAVNWAAAQGIVTGYSAAAFGPDDPVTREQLAVMLWRYAGSPAAAGSLDSFVDRNAAGSYAADALAWAVGEGLLSGKDGGRLDPTGTASRAELATILMRFEQ